jgi:hypothetical protein
MDSDLFGQEELKGTNIQPIAMEDAQDEGDLTKEEKEMYDQIKDEVKSSSDIVSKAEEMLY